MPYLRPALLVFVALLLPAPVLRASPPEPADGRMALDEVADGLRRYHRGDGRDRALLRRLAPTRDPRVAVALGEVLTSSEFPYQELALLAEFYLPEEMGRSTDAVWDWWKQNEPDLRRRARELP
jgi:hypothetical protein